MTISFDVPNEFDRLAHVVMGTSEGYHRDPARVEVVNGTQQRTVEAAGHPTEAQLAPEFAAFRAAMEAAGVAVHQPVLAPDSVQDQTCPRDIGFVIGEVFVAAGMRNQSRIEELEGIRNLLADCTGPTLEVPAGVALEGGDVVVDGAHLFVGCGQRSDPEGLPFLQAKFGEAFEIVPLPSRGLAEGEDVLHLDCAFNPLGLGHALIYPDGLASIPQVLRDKFHWIEVTREEATALATNVLSVAPDKIIARAGPACARVNGELRKAGYQVSEVAFDGVPSTGGSFRCATMPLRRVR